MVSLTKKLLADSEFSTEFNVMIDFKDSTGIAYRLNIIDYVEFVRKSVKQENPIKFGLMIVSPNHEFLARIFKGFGRILKMEINYFRSYTVLFNWLGLSAEHSEVVMNELEMLRNTKPQEL